MTMTVPPLFVFSLVLSSLAPLVSIHDKLAREKDMKIAFPENPRDFNLPIPQTFDYIIVGGGTAGLVLARRLSSKYCVCVLEAGGDPPPMSSVLYMSDFMDQPTEINFHYPSTPQKNSGMAFGGITSTTAGKMLGGCSSHNDGWYVRGHPRDYDRWAELTGDPSWRYENIHKYFLKSEDYHGQFHENQTHGHNGLWPVVSVNVSYQPQLFYSAGKEMGYDVIDPNGSNRVGFGPMEMNRDKMGRRVSTYTNYIRPIEGKRKRLTIMRYSVVSEVLFDEQGNRNRNRAIGVKFERHGVPSVAFASREVILSASAYVSPLILIRSGIGPKDQLEAANIKPRSILPVGFNLQNHHAIGDFEITVAKNSSVIKYSKENLQFSDLNEFVKKGTGPINSDGFDQAFIASSRAIQNGEENWPDLQFYLRPKSQDTFSCSPRLTRPQSRGRLYYNSSASTLEEQLTPILDFNYFGDSSDIDVYIEGIEFCKRIVKTETFQNIGAKMLATTGINNAISNSCSSFGGVESRDYLKCLIRHRKNASNHQVSTARMGKIGDPRSVVDSKLRVIGVDGLRVCDGSILPFIVNGNTANPIIMIAEKLAAEILQGES